jgi:hypothetical protein
VSHTVFLIIDYCVLQTSSGIGSDDGIGGSDDADQQQMLNKATSRNRQLWKMRFEELLRYKAEHGDTLVPHQYPDNPSLAQWVTTQRKTYKKCCEGQQPSSLDEEMIRMLNDVGFIWYPNSRLWTGRFQQLLAYKEQHGDTLVPRRYPDNPQLGHWVEKQRQQYKKYCKGTQPCYFDEEKVRMLHEVGFCWNLRSTWKDRFEELMEYINTHGDTLVPRLYPENPSLGNWVSTQRRQYQNYLKGKQPCSLDEAKIQRLNDVGFFRNSDISSSSSGVESDDDSTNDDEKQMLNEAGFSWNPPNYRYLWKDRFDQVPRRFPENPMLDHWVDNQRRQYQNYCKGKQPCSLDEAKIQIQTLNDVGIFRKGKRKKP